MPGFGPVHPAALTSYCLSPNTAGVLTTPTYSQFPGPDMLSPFPCHSSLGRLDKLPVVHWDSALGSGLAPSKTFSCSPHSHPVHATITTQIILHWNHLCRSSSGWVLVTFPSVSPIAKKYKIPEGKENEACNKSIQA